MDEKEFFNHMLEKTRKVFHTSKTFQKHGNQNWNYAVCDTPIQKNHGIFFGLNWGGNDVNVQSVYPEKVKDRSWNFIAQSTKYFQEFLNSKIEDLNYSNLCFFRSPHIEQIEPGDWELAIPLFQEYVDYINPPWTLMLGKPDQLWNNHISNQETVKVQDTENNKTVYGYKGTLFNKYPFASVPHPQAKISTQARKEIWQKVVSDNDSFTLDL